MAENKKRKLTEKDQTSFFDEEMMAEEPQIPEETDSDTKKNTSADSAQEEDIGAGSGFLFDLNEYGSESESVEEKDTAQTDLAETLVAQAESAAAELIEQDAKDEEAVVEKVEAEIVDAEMVPQPAMLSGTDIVEEAMKNAETDVDELTLAYFASRAYLEYAISVVKGRALPDVCDGMKPVQRRILYAMKRLGLSPDAKTVKSARVVGDVLGKYHPHGDSAAYDAMVRLAQDFTMRYPLVHGQGNFGSADGDGAAAMRYTEVKLSKYSELLLSEIDEGTVKFVPNYDGAFKEPTLLPARLPMLLLNGSSGIAVGMATEIPSHNLKEVAAATVKLIDQPETTTEELLEIIPGPDFPGGAQIISPQSDILSAYQSGYGSLQLRAVYHFEDLSRGLWQLVIDQLPYKVSAQKVLSEIDSLTNPKASSGKKTLSAKQQQDKQLLMNVISSVRDESNGEAAIRIVIDPKSKTVDRDELLNVLFSKTSLEVSCKFNLVLIGVDGKPKQKGLREILNEWISFRIRTVLARCGFRREEIRARIHVLEGRLTIIIDIDEAIRIIRTADDPKVGLMDHFHLTDKQAEDILEIRLRQLSGMDPIKMQKELDKLRKEEERLTELIDNDRTLRKQIIKEIEEDSETFGDERRTLIEEAQTAALTKRVVDEPVTVIISEKGFVRSRGGHSIDCKSMNYKLGDAYRMSFECRSVDNLYVLSDSGRIYCVPVSQLPSGRGDGTHISAFVQLQDGDRPLDYFAGSDDTKLLFSSDSGVGFFCKAGDLAVRQKAGKAFFTLEKGAKPLPIRTVSPITGWIAALSSSGRLVVFSVDELSARSSGGKGVSLMMISEGEKLVSAIPIAPNGVIVVGKGRGGKIQELVVGPRSVEDFRTRRGRKGRFVEARWTFLELRQNKPEKEMSPEERAQTESTII